MNIHAPPRKIREYWGCWDFRGKRWKVKDFTWIRVKHKVMSWSWYYCFELNCAVDRETYEDVNNH